MQSAEEDAACVALLVWTPCTMAPDHNTLCCAVARVMLHAVLLAQEAKQALVSTHTWQHVGE
jgi:hypothetical protein